MEFNLPSNPPATVLVSNIVEIFGIGGQGPARNPSGSLAEGF